MTFIVYLGLTATYESCERIHLLARPINVSIITTSGPIFHDPLEGLLEQLAERVDTVVNQIASESYQFERHEEFTTSRLTQAISAAVRNDPITVDGLTVEVHAEEFRPAQERKTGADLYVSLVRRDLDIPKSKGLLVQAKRRISLLKSGEPRRLGNQSKRMYRRSDESYVWIYERDRIVSAAAPQASQPQLSIITNPTSVGTLIADGLRCNRGDEEIGRDPSLPLHEGIIAVMNYLSVPDALDFDVIQT